ncbi:PURA, partial [Symbiodinium sp. KB8]
EERQQIPSVQLWVKTIALDDNDITLSLEKNDAGSFIRVAGRTPDERVLVPVVGALRMESILKDMFKIHEDTQPLHVEADRADLIKSISLYVGKKQLFFDLKATGFRRRVLIPIEGFKEFVDAFQDMVKENDLAVIVSASSGKGNEFEGKEYPSSYVVNAGRKKFFFDIGGNDEGSYMKITELAVGGNRSVRIPFGAWPTVQSIVNDYVSAMPAEDR